LHVGFAAVSRPNNNGWNQSAVNNNNPLQLYSCIGTRTLPTNFFLGPISLTSVCIRSSQKHFVFHALWKLHSALRIKQISQLYQYKHSVYNIINHNIIFVNRTFPFYIQLPPCCSRPRGIENKPALVLLLVNIDILIIIRVRML